MKKLFLTVFLILIWFGSAYSDRIGFMLNSEPDGTPSDVASYKIIWPNGTTSITNGVNTITLTASGVTVTDDESTDDEHEVVFTTNGSTMESDGDLTYNPSTGTLSATVFSEGGSALSSLYQGADGELSAIAGLTSAANKFIKFTGSGTAAVVDDSDMRFTEAQTMQAFTSTDATPDVTNGGTTIVRLWQTANASTTTITDFDDTDDHNEFATGDWFILRVDDANTTIDFSENANIEGNAGIDFTGSATQISYLLFIYDDSRWNEVTLQGMSTPTTMAVSKIQAAGNVITDDDGIVLTASQMNSTILMTGAGDVDIPADQCDTATGKWLIVKSSAAHLNSLTSNDASDQFILTDGTLLTAGNEVDLAGAVASQVCVQCLAANKWYITGEIGSCSDGGAAD